MGAWRRYAPDFESMTAMSLTWSNHWLAVERAGRVEIRSRYLSLSSNGPVQFRSPDLGSARGQSVLPETNLVTDQR